MNVLCVQTFVVSDKINSQTRSPLFTFLQFWMCLSQSWWTSAQTKHCELIFSEKSSFAPTVQKPSSFQGSNIVGNLAPIRILFQPSVLSTIPKFNNISIWLYQAVIVFIVNMRIYLEWLECWQMQQRVEWIYQHIWVGTFFGSVWSHQVKCTTKPK